MKFNFYNKKYAEITSGRLVLILLGLFVLVVSFSIYFQIRDNSDFLRNEVANEQSCKSFGYENYDQQVYCDNNRISEDVSENLMYLLCDIESEEYALYEEVKEYTESEEECNELGDEECTCVMNAFFYQRNRSMELLNGNLDGSGVTGIGGIIGDKDTGQEESTIDQFLNMLSRDSSQELLDSAGEPVFYDYTAIYEEPIDENHPVLLAQSSYITPNFIKKVNQVAAKLGTDPRFLMALMAFETGGSFDPCQKVIGCDECSATGLIQFLSTTASDLGTSTDQLCRMDSVKQLEYVELYFEKRAISRGYTLDTIEKTYTAVLSGTPKEGDEVLFSSPSQKYYANDGLDTVHGDNDGKITVGEATRPVKLWYNKFFGELIDRKIRDSTTYSVEGSQLLSEYTNSDRSPLAIGSDHELWSKLHSDVSSEENYILYRNKNDGYDAQIHTIYSNVLIATSEAAKRARELGCEMDITSGNRHEYSSSSNHAQNGKTGNALDFILHTPGNRENRCSAQQYAEVIFTAYLNGATEFGFGVSNGAGSHIGVSTSGGKRPSDSENGIAQWNYDSSGQTARNIFNDLVANHNTKTPESTS